MSLIHIHQCIRTRCGRLIEHTSRIILAVLMYASGLTGCGDSSNVTPPPAGPGPLSIATQSPLPSGTVNQPYATVIGGSGGTTPYTWSLVSGSPALPAGLSLNAITGAIVGTPSALETTTPIFRLQDAASPANAIQKSLTISILTVPQSLSITTASLPGGVVNQPYPNTALAATGGLLPYTWSVNPALPTGLQFNVLSSGAISGTPLAGAEGTTSHTFTVIDSAVPSNQTDNRQLSLTINLAPSPLTITFPTRNRMPDATEDEPYSQTLQASGGTLPYTWSVSPALPSWLQLDPTTGTLTGTPPNDNDFTRTYTVRDSTLPTNLTDSRSISLRIRD
jgi:hypothetical protein